MRSMCANILTVLRRHFTTCVGNMPMESQDTYLKPEIHRIMKPVDRRRGTPTNIDVSKQMLELLNNERSQYDLPALTIHPALQAAAQGHSEDQAKHDRLNHYGSDGSTWADRCAAAGYPGADLTNVRENVAAGQTSPEQAVGDWMQSPGHRDAIMDRTIRHLGSGVATGRSGWMYWTVDFCHGAEEPYNITFR